MAEIRQPSHSGHRYALGDFVAYPSRPRIAKLALMAGGFVVLGLWMVGAFGDQPNPDRYSSGRQLFVGWSSVVFSGLCGILGVKRLFDTKEQLRIGPAGVRWAQWSESTIPWSEIVDITTWSTHGQTFIVLHLRDKARFPGRGLASILATGNRIMTGGDISISLTGTNRKIEDALSSIERFRAGTA